MQPGDNGCDRECAGGAAGDEGGGDAVQWTVVIPRSPGAGQEQARGHRPDGLRPGLALAFAQDTVAAALACPAVRDVAVVTDDALAAPAGGPGRPRSCPTSPAAA